MVIQKLHVSDCGLHISPKKRVKGSTLSPATWTIFNMGSPVSGTNIKIHLQELKLILLFAFCACIILTVSQKVLKLRLVEYRGHCIRVVCLLVCFLFLFLVCLIFSSVYLLYWGYWIVSALFKQHGQRSKPRVECRWQMGISDTKGWSAAVKDISAAASHRLRDETSQICSTNESLVPKI